MSAPASRVVSPSPIVDRVAASGSVRILAVLFVAALTAAASQVSVPLPFTPVPFTLQPAVVLLGAAALGARLGASAQVLYLLLGIAGTPVFAFAPELPMGALRLLGPSGGYLMAYPLAACATGALFERGWARGYASRTLALAAGLSIIFGGGVLWLAKDLGLWTAVAVGLVPFALADALKIAVASALIPAVGKAFRG